MLVEPKIILSERTLSEASTIVSQYKIKIFVCLSSLVWGHWMDRDGVHLFLPFMQYWVAGVYVSVMCIVQGDT